MRKTMKGLVLLAALLALMAVAGAAMAESNLTTRAPGQRLLIKKLQFGTFYHLATPYDTDEVYRVDVAKDTFITMSWKNNMSSGIWVQFFTDPTCTVEYCVTGFYDRNATTGTQTNVLRKGTYFVKMYDTYGLSSVKFTRAVVSYGQNYCVSKATKLKAGKRVRIGQTLPLNYPRWYKIKLTKKKKISIYPEEWSSSAITLYDADMQQVPVIQQRTLIETDDVVSKGWYYIRVSDSNTFRWPRTTGEYLGFKWK